MKFFGHMFPREIKVSMRCYLRPLHVLEGMISSQRIITIILLSIVGGELDHEVIYTYAPEEYQLLDKMLPAAFFPSSERISLQGHLTPGFLSRRW
jgi:hypothetical protein